MSQFKAEGAITPSDKLRALIRDSREKQTQLQDFRGSIDTFEKMLAPINAMIREAELSHSIHSELVTRIMAWLPDIMALVVITGKNLEQSQDQETLKAFEDCLADRVFRLVETVLQTGLTETNSCYNPDAISSRMEPVLELSEIIRNRRK